LHHGAILIGSGTVCILIQGTRAECDPAFRGEAGLAATAKPVQLAEGGTSELKWPSMVASMVVAGNIHLLCKPIFCMRV
jgi:hypothetical protein